MAMSPDDMVPSGPSSSGQQAVIAYLQSKGMPVNAGNIRRAIEANAREPGDPSANGPNLGPVVLNLRNAGIEDASPMPARGAPTQGGGGDTSAPPTSSAPNAASDSATGASLPSIPPPFVGFNPNAPGQALTPEQQQLRLSSPPPTPALMGPDGVPLLGGPDSSGLSLPELGTGAAIAGGIPLIELLRRSLLSGPTAAPQLGGPTPAPAVGGPPPVPQLPAPAERPPIALPQQSTGKPAIPLPDAGVPPPMLQTPGVDLQRPPASSVGPAIDKALQPPAVERAPVRGLPRGRPPVMRPPRLR